LSFPQIPTVVSVTSLTKWCFSDILLSSYTAGSTALEITTPYSLYICPEGQNVTLTCKLRGFLIDHHVFISKLWYFSNQGDKSCSERKYIRNVSMKELHQEPGKQHYVSGHHGDHSGLEISSDHHGTFHITLRNLTLQDSGNYCCYAVEAKKEHNKPRILEDAHANGTVQNCTFHLPASTESENVTAAALATGACIVGILCLPLILFLIYKQRQAVANRRALELVRMESNAHGMENPVFDAEPASNLESKPRPQLSLMASHQHSESDRHLLSPNTPLSPPAPGDCFFPSLGKHPILYALMKCLLFCSSKYISIASLDGVISCSEDSL
uniref:Ig-like domain-containing protein n=1 Tax=Salvator merianae TaxID=96440 RepID=A0A8D0BS10_SALMN